MSDNVIYAWRVLELVIQRVNIGGVNASASLTKDNLPVVKALRVVSVAPFLHWKNKVIVFSKGERG